MSVISDTCRNSANSQLSKVRQRDGEQVLQYLEDNGEVLTMMDSSIVVECAFFAIWLEVVASSF